FAGARLRLAELTPATDLRSFGGRPYTPPASVRVWRAEIVFAGAARDALAGCRLTLEDDAGRTFDASPAELRRLRVPFASCAPPPAPAATPSSTMPAEYTTMAYFVTPAGARP